MRRILFMASALAAIGLVGYFLGRPGAVPADPLPTPPIDIQQFLADADRKFADGFKGEASKLYEIILSHPKSTNQERVWARNRLAIMGPLAVAPPEPAGASKPANTKSTAQQLPIKRIILFSNGVAYVQREGQVEGNARVDLSFPQQNINDLLKSMVLEDMGGGSISTVSFDSHDPIAKTLKSFAVDLNSNPSLGQILNQARGEKIEVTTQPPDTMPPLPDTPADARRKARAMVVTGAVIGIETRKVPDVTVNTSADLEHLNLKCEDGIRSVPLTDVQRLRFLNEALNVDFQRALEVLANSHDTQKKAVSLNFTGQGKRTVRVGYVVENPLWRTSYRLMANKDGKLFLQGWAMVENPSNEDWKDVGLSLVSGQPISFQMDLYQPLYASRPVVQPELYGNIRPVVYGGSVDASLARFDRMIIGTASMTGTGEKNLPAKISGTSLPGNSAVPQAPAPGLAQGPDVRFMGSYSPFGFGTRLDGNGTQLDQRGVITSAKGSDRGDFFQYDIQQAVTLPRQKSAMLPIVNKEIGGAKVSIYNEATHAKYPFFGLQLKNNTGLHLTQGPIAVFDGGSYAGDAPMLDLQPKEERLISYAVDLGTEVEPLVKQSPVRMMSIKVHKGVFSSTVKVRESKTYNVKNRSSQERTLLIEHPFRADYQLVSKMQPKERSREVYRFEVKVAPGKSARLEVVEEREVSNELALTNMSEKLVLFLEKNVKDDKAAEVFRQGLKIREKLSSAQALLSSKQQQLNDITQDQARLRANLKEMPQTAAAYKRYLNKFDDQETDIENLQAEIKKVRENQVKEQQAFEQFLLKLNLESTSVGGAEGVPLSEESQPAVIGGLVPGTVSRNIP